MSEILLVGRGNKVTEIPLAGMMRFLAKAPQRGQKFLSFMTPVHHALRNFLVTELARTGQPISPNILAQQLGLNIEEVISILDELEKKLVFLVRNNRGNVSWAFPITVEVTPHQLTISDGKIIYGA